MEMMMMMMVVMTMINILLLMIDFAPMDKKNDYFVKLDRQSNGRMKRQTQACRDAMDASKNWEIGIEKKMRVKDWKIKIAEM